MASMAIMPCRSSAGRAPRRSMMVDSTPTLHSPTTLPGRAQLLHKPPGQSLVNPIGLLQRDPMPATDHLCFPAPVDPLP